jgi:hypothetical protein
LTAAVPFGEVSIPVAEINQGAFAEISQAILNGTIIEATLTSEGTFFCINNSETSIKGNKPTAEFYRQSLEQYSWRNTCHRSLSCDFHCNSGWFDWFCSVQTDLLHPGSKIAI